MFVLKSVTWYYKKYDINKSIIHKKLMIDKFHGYGRKFSKSR